MKNTILRSSALVMLATIMLRSLGFIREITLAATYGTGAVADAFIIAYALPGSVLAIISSAVSARFIPMYYGLNGDKRPFVNNVISCLAVLGLAVSVVFSIFPQALVYTFASRFEPQRFELTVVFLRITIWATIPILISDILRSYLQINEVFFSSLILNAFVNLCIIPAIILSRQWLPLIAIGILVGNMLSLLALSMLGNKHGFIYRPYIDINDKAFRELINSLLPLIVSGGILEFNMIIDRNFASSLSVGIISSMNYAAKLSNLVTAATGAALVIVLFPRMSEMANRGDIGSIKRYLSICIERLIAIILPVSIGAIVLASPIIRILFERGLFAMEDTLRTAECLRMYALGFVINSVNTLLIRAFYAMGNSKVPAVCSMISVGSNVIINFLLFSALQHRGLILATVIAGLISTVLLLIIIKKQFGSLGLAAGVPEILKAVFASSIMGVLVYFGFHMLPVMASESIECLAYTIGLIAGGALIYVLLHAALRTAFFTDAVQQIKK